MKNKKQSADEMEESKIKEVKLKSEMYNHDNELLDKRENEGASDAIMWGSVIGFILFFILLIMLICFTH